jgi:hypothetical protein
MYMLFRVICLKVVVCLPMLVVFMGADHHDGDEESLSSPRKSILSIDCDVTSRAHLLLDNDDRTRLVA